MSSMFKQSVPVLVLTLVAAGATPARAVPQQGAAVRAAEESLLRDLGTTARERVALRSKTAFVSLRITNSAVAHYPALGLTMYAYKMVDDDSGELHKIMLDRSGAEVDPELLAQGELEAAAERHGTLEPELFERILRQRGEEPIPVILWLKDVVSFSPERPDAELALTAEQVRAVLDRNDAARREIVAATIEPVVRDLRARGLDVDSDPLVPVVYVALSPRMIDEVSQWVEVERVYLARRSEPALDVSRVVTGMALAQNSYGANGQGIKVGEIEVGGDVNTLNPFLPNVFRNTTCGFFDNHGTGVAGVIQSSHATHRGYAPSCALFAGSDCFGGWAPLQTQATAAVNWGAQALNLSFGADIGSVPGQQDRFYDTIVYNNLRSVVVAAGNTGNGTGNIISPAMGYNVIAVGNFNDNGTNSTSVNNYAATWGDDAMSSSSSWRDPSSVFMDREKPELAAPGSNITMTSIAYPWVSYTDSGTSFAAPAVTGTVAAMLSQNVNLPGWPEAVKAILMATALHNVEGSARLSEKDGAGALDAYAAVRCARRTAGNWGGYSYSCSKRQRHRHPDLRGGGAAHARGDRLANQPELRQLRERAERGPRSARAQSVRCRGGPVEQLRQHVRADRLHARDHRLVHATREQGVVRRQPACVRLGLVPVMHGTVTAMIGSGRGLPRSCGGPRPPRPWRAAAESLMARQNPT
ncbi:MAG: S8 family serine peptidase [Planctomycetota bacterium]